MTPYTAIHEKLLIAAILFCTACSLIPDAAFASQALPRCHYYNSGANHIRTFASWIFAILFLVPVVDHIRTARKEKTPTKKQKIFFGTFACLVLAALPFLASQMPIVDNWMPGIVVCVAGGWLAYKLMRSIPFPIVISTALALCFTAVLGWPFVYYSYTSSHPADCSMGEPSLLHLEAREKQP